MTVYNGGSYLQAAVESVLAQAFNSFELLIIDDHSTDGALEALSCRHDERLRIHRNPVNIGQTASLNLGLSLARGRYIARMDADDMAYPGWLAHQFEYLNSHPDCAVAGCMARVMDQDGRVFKKLHTPLQREEMVLKSFFASPLNHVGVMMDKETVVSHGGYDASLRIAADFDLWSKFLRAGVIMTTLPFEGVAIRAHRASVSAMHKGRGDMPEICRVIRDNIAHFTSKTLSDEQLGKWYLFIYSPQELSADDFIQMQEMMRDIYLPYPSFNQRQQRLFLIKGILAMAQQRVYGQLRRLLSLELKKYGLFSFEGLVWVLSLGGLLCPLWTGFYDFSRRMELLCRVNR